MNSSSEGDFGRKLLFVLKKITGTQCKTVNNIYLEKLLSNIKSELDKDYKNYIHLHDISEWLKETLEMWRGNHPSICAASFVYEFIKILSKNEEVFNFLQKINVLNDCIDILQNDVLNISTLKIAHIRLLSDILNHNSGFEWVKISQQWKIVIKLCMLNSNFYVEKEGLTFIKKLINGIKSDNNIIEEIFREILLPLKGREGTTKNETSNSKICFSLKLVETILKLFITSEDNTICLKLSKVFDLETFLLSLLENCSEKAILDAASTLYVVFLIVKFENKHELLLLQHIPSNILEIFHILLKQNQIESIIKLGKFCQLLWTEMRNDLKCDCSTVVHFIILELVPVLMYNKKPPDTKLFDLFVQKLFNLTSDTTQRFGYSLRDAIKGRTDSKLRDWAGKSVLSITGNIETLSLNEAVIIFQSLAYVLKVFVPESTCDELLTTDNKLEKEELLSVVDASLLSVVLNALCILIQKFKINWTESLESLCLLKMTCNLLQSTPLSSILIVQTLSLMKLTILNFMSPNLALLLNKSEDSSFESLMSLLCKRMQDPNWEIRDSCIEVITTITELAESKYPAFQQLLLEKDICSVIFDIMQNDSESYVKASALRALSSLTKLEILSQCLNRLDFSTKIIQILETESEGIVRREAALLITQIYLVQREPSDLLSSFYQIMGYSAIYDLHWEVKVNSLLFWETVIQRVITDQGMIDGSFPKVTFSKEHKKIVTLTSDEIKMRLHKVLKELSKIGCLHVLLSTLNDECDIQVAYKSAQILTHFVSILKRYDVIKPCENLPICDRICMKRKSTDFSICEKRKPSNLILNNDVLLNERTSNIVTEQCPDSDEVIEEIVNEMDINLLVSVCHPKEEKIILRKKVVLQEIKPEAFLLQMQSFDSEKFLQNKEKWFMNAEFDLKSLVNDIIILDSVNETNIMDCY